jgi:hypothetical protein
MRQKHKTKIFLGGTCNGSHWREEVIPRLRIDYFNPVVSKWTDEAYERELKERETCDLCLYVITPKAEGYYSIAEVADDSNKRPEKTVMCLLTEDDGLHFPPHQLKSLRKVGQLIADNGAYFCEGLEALHEYLTAHDVEVPEGAS